MEDNAETKWVADVAIFIFGLDLLIMKISTQDNSNDKGSLFVISCHEDGTAAIARKRSEVGQKRWMIVRWQQWRTGEYSLPRNRKTSSVGLESFWIREDE
jgi:hypothetical protein